MVSKQLVVLRSSANDNKRLYKKIIRTLENAKFSGVLSLMMTCARSVQVFVFITNIRKFD